MYQVTVPGKLIISGEHAVVYGNPALAGAIDRHVQVRLAFLDEPVIQFAFAEYKQPLVSFTFNEFWQTLAQLDQRYQQYLEGKCTVTEIATQLYDLPVYALGLCAKLAKKAFTQGIRLTLSGDLPIGYGLGSSAAVVVGIIRAATHVFGCANNLQQMQRLAMQAENLQHGLSSGLDPSVCLHGGILLYSLDTLVKRAYPAWGAYLLNTGQPLSSTGECVAWVKQHALMQRRLDKFKAVTLACDSALATHSPSALKAAIRENHRLLCELEVVPTRVQDCIAELEKNHYAAKICGAGSIKGQNAGYVIVLGDDPLLLDSIAHAFDFTVEQVRLGVNV